MKVPTRFVEPLSQEDIQTLEELWKSAESHRTRTRALAVLLSHRDYSIDQIAEICSVNRDTVRGWIDAWEQEGPDGLHDAPRSGAPRRFEPDEEARVAELLREYPNQPKTVQALAEQETGKELTDDILYRIAHEREHR